LHINHDGVRRSGMDLLALPGVTLPVLRRIWPDLPIYSDGIERQVEIEGQYAVYIRRQAADIQALRRDEATALPEDLDVDGIPGLSLEVREKLRRVRPVSLGQAARIDGMTPAALALLLARTQGKRH